MRIRLFAAAKAAVGAPELDGTPLLGASIGELLDGLASTREDEGGAEAARAVFARCSFLLNGRATTDRSLVPQAGDLLDVLPPFAGG